MKDISLNPPSYLHPYDAANWTGYILANVLAKHRSIPLKSFAEKVMDEDGFQSPFQQTVFGRLNPESGILSGATISSHPNPSPRDLVNAVCDKFNVPLLNGDEWGERAGMAARLALSLGARDWQWYSGRVSDIMSRPDTFGGGACSMQGLPAEMFEMYDICQQAGILRVAILPPKYGGAMLARFAVWTLPDGRNMMTQPIIFDPLLSGKALRKGMTYFLLRNGVSECLHEPTTRLIGGLRLVGTNSRTEFIPVPAECAAVSKFPCCDLPYLVRDAAGQWYLVAGDPAARRDLRLDHIYGIARTYGGFSLLHLSEEAPPDKCPYCGCDYQHEGYDGFCSSQCYDYYIWNGCDNDVDPDISTDTQSV
jgi:hypothetical protein